MIIFAHIISVCINKPDLKLNIIRNGSISKQN